jgi:hypothetical protein
LVQAKPLDTQTPSLVQRRVKAEGGTAERRTMPQEMIPGYTERFRTRPRLICRPPVIQRAKIDYKQLTWNDFQGKVPEKSDVDAKTFSAFHNPKIEDLFPVPEDLKAIDTGEECKIGKKKVTKFKVNIQLDSEKVQVKPYMEQEKSWRNPWTTDQDAWKERCEAKEVKECQSSFDVIYGQETENATKQAVKECQKALKDDIKERTEECKQKQETCKEKEFKDGQSWIFDGIEITSKDECSTVLFPECKESVMKDLVYSFSFEGVTGEATANTIEECSSTFKTSYADLYKKSRFVEMEMLGEKVEVPNKDECSTTFLQWCVDRWQPMSQHLLKHEQGHFDITRIEADTTEKALRTQIASFDKEIIECGESQALKAAKKTWKDNVKKLTEKYEAAVKSHDKRQEDYDQETKHSQELSEQATWTKTLSDELEAINKALEKTGESQPEATP